MNYIAKNKIMGKTKNRKNTIDARLLESLNYITSETPFAFSARPLYKESSIGRTWHWHPALQMSKIACGKVRYQVRDLSFVLEEGDVILININQLHRYGLEKSGENSIFSPKNDFAKVINVVYLPEFIAAPESLTFKKYISPLIVDETRPCIVFKREIPWHREIIDLFNKAVEIEEKSHMGDDNIPYEMEIHELYSHIWRCIIEHADEIERCNVSKSKAVAQVRVRQMIDYIEQNFGNKITLDDMAAAACISKREVSRCFKENMGRTPFEYLIEYRIAKGKIKLLTTDDTVLEVALQCGFESASYFTRMFKRYEGISPLEFRNKMKKG